MKILLCCAGGFSTNMLMQNMKKVVKESAKLNEADFDFTAIPADSLESEIDNWDIVLVGPQVSHKVDFIESYDFNNNDPTRIQVEQADKVAFRTRLEECHRVIKTSNYPKLGKEDPTKGKAYCESMGCEFLKNCFPVDK